MENEIQKKQSSNHKQEVVEPVAADTLLPIKNRHGFSNPLTVQQSVPILLILLTFTQAIFMLTSDGDPPNSSSIAVLVLLTLTLLVVIGFWLRVTACDPTDEIQLRHRRCILNSTELDAQSSRFFCRLCQTHRSQHSYHCMRCGRCVQYFDHHCIWVNNCIGEKNYWSFLCLLVSGLVLFLEILALNSVLLADEKVLYRKIIKALTILITTVPIVSMVYLLSLHIYLLVTRKSTVSLILKHRKKNKVYVSEVPLQSVMTKNREAGLSTDEQFMNQPVMIFSSAGQTIRKVPRNIGTKACPLPPLNTV